MSRYALALGDVLTVIKEQPDNAFDALFCDPPYGLHARMPTVDELEAYLKGEDLDIGADFMGADWCVPSVTIWREAFRVLKPGAPLIVFGGARTSWLIALGLCAAGFEIRDCFMWLHARGRPTTTDKSKVPVEGHNTALKPAFEPAWLARKPLEGTVGENFEKWGTGLLSIDACRVNERWPANVVLDEEAAAQLDELVGPTKSHPYPEHEAEGAVLPMTKRTAGGYADSGVVSRFFYVSKAGRKERDFGCDDLPLRTPGEATRRKEGSAGLKSSRAGAGRTGGVRNHHPCLKPIALTEYMARLIKPPTEDAVLLVPFAGAGSEVIGALRAGWPAVLGIEREAEYLEIAGARIPANVPGAERVA